MEKSIKSVATNYGLYLGILLVFWTGLCYVISLELLVNFWFNLLVLPLVIIVFGVISISKSKKNLGGFISFKEAFTSYFITILIGLLISSVVSIVLFNFVDTEAAGELKEIVVEKTISMMERFSAPPETIATQIEALEAQDTFSFKTQFLQFLQGLLFFTIIGLIAAAIMKKNNPES